MCYRNDYSNVLLSKLYWDLGNGAHLDENALGQDGWSLAEGWWQESPPRVSRRHLQLGQVKLPATPALETFTCIFVCDLLFSWSRF